MAVMRNDPYGAFNFLVEIDGITDGTAQASFSEATGLEADVNVIEYRTGSEPNVVRKFPGLQKFPNIVLKRGITGDLALWQWMKSVLDGQTIRTNGSIILLDESRQPVLRWRFLRGFPCKLVGPTLNAKSNEIAIETLEIAHEGLTIE